MDLVEAIPEKLAPHIRGELKHGELLMILLAADIRADGQYGDSWFALTDERLIVFQPKTTAKTTYGISRSSKSSASKCATTWAAAPCSSNWKTKPSN